MNTALLAVLTTGVTLGGVVFADESARNAGSMMTEPRGEWTMQDMRRLMHGSVMHASGLANPCGLEFDRAFAWVLPEYARGLGSFALMWGTLGYAFLSTPLMQIADLGGIHLVSLLVALAASVIIG